MLELLWLNPILTAFQWSPILQWVLDHYAHYSVQLKNHNHEVTNFDSPRLRSVLVKLVGILLLFSFFFFQHNGEWPKNYREKTQFKEYLRKGKTNIDKRMQYL